MTCVCMKITSICGIWTIKNGHSRFHINAGALIVAGIDTTVYKTGRSARRKIRVLSSTEHLIENYIISGFLLHNSTGNYIINTDIQLKTFIHGIEVFNMKITMRWERLRQRRNLSDERI